jgi:hypothetical protein
VTASSSPRRLPIRPAVLNRTASEPGGVHATPRHNSTEATECHPLADWEWQREVFGFVPLARHV